MAINRRSFLTTVGGTAGALLTGCALPCRRKEGVRTALQLYSIHKIFWKEPARCLAELRAAGYDGVEFAGYAGHSAAEIRALLADHALAGAGTHVNGNVDLVGDNLKRTLDFCAAAGIESVTTPHAKKDSADDYRRFGEAMGRAAEAARVYGIAVGIHSTYHHFTTVYDGVTAWDLMFANASPLLQQQVDTGNTFHTGTDVVQLLKKYPNRHHSIHLKENDPTTDAVFGSRPTDGGACVPFADIVRHMRGETGHKWWIVEAERVPDSLEPAKRCRQILAGWTAEA